MLIIVQSTATILHLHGASSQTQDLDVAKYVPAARRCPHEDPARRRSAPGMAERHPTFRAPFCRTSAPIPAASGLKNREDENSDPLLLAFYDWGSWWQGEIAGEYFISNSNLKSPQIRAHVTPSEAVRRHAGCSGDSTASAQGGVTNG